MKRPTVVKAEIRAAMPPAGELVVVSEQRLISLIHGAINDVLGKTNTEEPLLLTGAQLGQKLGVSRATVHRWRKRGMPAIPCGDEFRFEVAACLAWLKSGADSK